MKLESQVASLDLSKKLKALGVVQESAFYWFEHKWRGKYPEHENDFVFKHEPDDESLYPKEYWNSFAAFTVAELGVMLPKEYVTARYGNEWGGYERDDEGLGLIYTPWPWPNTEANARAKMLVYLIEKGIVKP